MSAALAPDARVLVICVARIGDTLLITPALRALKEAAPAGETTCLAHPGRMEVLAHGRYLDRLGAISKRSAWARGWLPGRPWDYALVYGRDQALVRYALRSARRVVAFEQADPALNGRLYRAVAPPAKTVHAAVERLMLTDALGIRPSSRRLDYVVTAEEARWAGQAIASRLPGQARPLIGLQVAGLPFKAHRDWPGEHWVALGQRLLAAFSGARLILLGGPEERDKAQDIAGQIGPGAVSVAGEFAFRQSAALLSLLDLYVGTDTGPTHLAGALGLPMVGLYHPRHRGRDLAPLDHPAPLAVIEHPRTEADRALDAPMSEIPVDEAFAAAVQILAGGPVARTGTARTVC